jgi:hypothetical protein
MLNRTPLLIALLTVCLSLVAMAQSGPNGVVQDPNGAAISGAKVTVTIAETGLSQTAT